ncbi:GNAT family N-acetyltransferase [Maribacter arenosus]|uniref:GNAT family N-acetyltransferase n=1 Tax=Maribacter arenosus TaxID=1854708 RepID=UPI00293C11AC|nr:GNAT family N-acetyltransferase [Maribacter arenosus]
MRKTLILLTSIFLIGLQHTILAQSKPFVPAGFKVPDTLQNEHFRIRMLTVNDVVKDYDAVMSSIEHLKAMYPTSSWPSKDLTFEQDLIDLGWHQKEFQMRSSFAYTVVSIDENKVLGCLYINPTTKGDYDASITMWVRASEVDNGLDPILFDSVKMWISKEWPFKKVAYPGREINWTDWKSMN